jgi:hypothetical protein
VIGSQPALIQEIVRNLAVRGVEPHRGIVIPRRHFPKSRQRSHRQPPIIIRSNDSFQ